MAKTSENVVMKDALVRDGIVHMMIALVLYTYATKMYCIFLKDQTGKVPVRSVYMVPVVALARAA